MKARWIFLLLACIGVSAEAGSIHYVKRSPNRRYLIGTDNKPFLIAGDSPQSLMVNVSTNDADMYFADRQSNGFNAVWINLICTVYTAGNPDGSTFDGILPFTGFVPGGTDLDHYDLTKPNEAYFERCDQMIRLANKHGLIVFLDPIETGGWSTTVLNNGAKNCQAVLVLWQIPNERLIDFNRVERKTAQITERRVAGSEVVHCDTDPESLELVENGQS